MTSNSTLGGKTSGSCKVGSALLSTRANEVRMLERASHLEGTASAIPVHQTGANDLSDASEKLQPHLWFCSLTLGIFLASQISQTVSPCETVHCT